MSLLEILALVLICIIAMPMRITTKMSYDVEKEIKKAIEAQEKYCNDNELPLFAPRNGVCWSCDKNIYNTHKDNHIDLKQASGELVTGCPFCFKSYCD